jgi:hypothetical protein
VLFTDWLASVKAYYFFRNMNLLKELMVELESKEFQPNQHQRNSGPADAKTVDVCLQDVLVLCREHFTSVGSVSRNGWVVSSVPAAILCFGTPTIPQALRFMKITYFYQVFSVCFLAITSLNVDTVIAALMVFVMSQCDILCDNLRNLHNKENDYDGELKNA